MLRINIFITLGTEPSLLRVNVIFLRELIDGSRKLQVF